jgi:hypothetical protein
MVVSSNPAQDSGDTQQHKRKVLSSSSIHSCLHSLLKQTQAGQIIDIRSMINDATRLNVEEGSTTDVSLSLIASL